MLVVNNNFLSKMAAFFSRDAVRISQSTDQAELQKMLLPDRVAQKDHNEADIQKHGTFAPPSRTASFPLAASGVASEPSVQETKEALPSYIESQYSIAHCLRVTDSSRQ